MGSLAGLLVKGYRHSGSLAVALALLLFLNPGMGQARTQVLTPLRLAPAPTPTPGEQCEQHSDRPPGDSAAAGKTGGRPDGKPDSKPGSKPSGRPGGKPSGKPGGQAPSESEHRPQPIRTYSFNEPRRLATVEAFVRRPDGTVIQPDLQLGVNPSLTFTTPLGEGPDHGANNVYLVEQGVEDQALVVRTAQWITMHHNCGWGHDHKFDHERTQPQALGTIPIEIVGSDLWDPNFHAKVTSGQQLSITVLSYGKPLVGARVRVQTEQKWVKEVETGQDGTTTLQLIRDYYPANWSDFNRTSREEFLVTASYEADQPGIFKDLNYDRVRYSVTLPWHYSPGLPDYSSYGLGLAIGLLGLTLTGGGVYFYRERRKKPYRGISLEE